jgi:hypothetical protein
VNQRWNKEQKSFRARFKKIASGENMIVLMAREGRASHTDDARAVDVGATHRCTLCEER